MSLREFDVDCFACRGLAKPYAGYCPELAGFTEDMDPGISMEDRIP